MKVYAKPEIQSETCFECDALACGKNPVPPAGSHHFRSAYDTFTGHLGAAMGTGSSVSPGQAGVGFGPGGTSQSYAYYGLCSNWVSLASS